MEQEIIYITRAIENWKAEDREIELVFEETIIKEFHLIDYELPRIE